MKKIIILICGVFFTLSAFAQQNVTLNINHFLGVSPFAFSAAADNNLGNNFSVTRLEYYISQITFVHDGGQETMVPNTWILVDAGTAVSENLGSFNITTLEAIKLSIGVEPAANHSDPATYPAGHPLALKSPSMHWGWTAGYRFVAMEGKCGTGLNLGYEIHALGDGNYHTFTIATSGSVSGNDLTINLQADYIGALENIDVSSGTVMHGETGVAADLLVNFAYQVFTANGATSMGTPENENLKLAIAPNPTNGRISVVFQNTNAVDVQVIDVTGRLISTYQNVVSGTEINLPQNSIYFVAIVKDGLRISVEKVVVTP